MARKRCLNEDILRLLKEIEIHISLDCDVSSVCCQTGIKIGKINYIVELHR